ncbi:hypothetical protein NDU88_002734 [Pleurodeles waltl]|uniref:Uncharacterized protein n=1 Tax=Pleurodeles waltl TaxID=8319 RepID=A0AAV7UYH5_PLEWA|nr:hypothetical protein NDU88_002734 [Pleurodeles waltl]
MYRPGTVANLIKDPVVEWKDSESTNAAIPGAHCGLGLALVGCWENLKAHREGETEEIPVSGHNTFPFTSFLHEKLMFPGHDNGTSEYWESRW